MTDPTPPAEQNPSPPAGAADSPPADTAGEAGSVQPEVLDGAQEAGEPVQEPDPAPVVVEQPPEGKIFGSDLEAALDEKLATARQKDQGESRHWGFRGKYYRLRPRIPGSTVLTSMELANEKRADKLVELIKAFFVDEDGDAFVTALKGEIVDLEPGEVAMVLQKIVTDLFGIYSNRPLVK